MIRNLYRKTMISLGKAIGAAICEPQLRLGRRNHNGTCDACNEVLGRYAMERLDFPKKDPEGTIDHMRTMMNAEYRRVCLECESREEPP